MTSPCRPGRHRAAILVILGVILGLSGACAPPAAAEDYSPAAQVALLRRVLPTVVSISIRKETGKAQTPSDAAATDTPDDKTEFGSGFIVDASGVIVTNYHVVDNAWEITVGLSDGTKLPARLMAATRLVDVALLKIEAGHPLPVVTWGDSDMLPVGEPVLAVGNPFGIGISVAGGIVSALHRDISDSPYDDFIQTDAAINHGNSGGPLFDHTGAVVGMDTALISPTKASTGLGFAIPSRSTRAIIDRLQEFGWLRPGWIGMKVQQLTMGMAEAFGLAKADGSIVASVTPGGPAERAGLRVGDIIVRLNDTTPSNERDLLRMIAKSPIGGTDRMAVLRGGQEVAIAVSVAEWPREQWNMIDKPVAMPPFRAIAPDLGIALAPATSEETTKLGVADPRPGVIVTAVAAATDAGDRGMVPGDIIMQVMAQDVSTPAEVQQGIDAARAEKRDFVVMLVWPKVRAKPGPTWVALRVASNRNQ